ncbi:phosphate ABC transporter permease PstA [Mesorhizobium sp. J428]|uniref:phosphate ABC transporter permease PstA n=1 Tax=Mesorhizobium sp. J428 TaxID=2898440 RepID=UPI002151612B|nr:phosphate ABC transporter permease PstA [Mesorhizobium sp. J428]MCR5856889.1 phosphate ABC transporter permease PstA [Mesorhizobium sp. J428]
MTDIVATPLSPRGAPSIHTDDAAKARLKSRYGAELRFKWLGAGAVALAAFFLLLLISTIVTQGLPAFRMNYLTLPIDLSAVPADPAARTGFDYAGPVNEALAAKFPDVTGRQERRLLRGIVSTGAGVILRQQVEKDPSLAGKTVDVQVPLDDFADLYLKGLLAESAAPQQLPGVTVSGTSGDVAVTFADDTITRLARGAGAIEAEGGVLRLTSGAASLLLDAGGGTVKLTEVGPGTAKGIVYEALDAAVSTASPAVLRTITTPEASRKITDREIVWLDRLKADGAVTNTWNTIFFTSGASREAELAGVWGAVVGSFLTLIVTIAVAFPIGVAAAIYLEEFAPKNRFTSLIEVNINNLAAVPSIVFGLLGLAVFLNFFGMPRSAPVVGGLVLALMTLPIIIIAGRASLRAVPPSIREAALGIGASKVQMVFHHVLPLAMPGIMTGTILGMAHALGETAPLLMIGMVAFIVDIPGGFTEPATILPVQIFMWADFPEPAFQQKTSAAIMVLLGFLILMNAIAVILRKRFERRW